MRGAGVDMRKWRCELRNAFPSPLSSASSTSSASSRSSSSSSASCASPRTSSCSSPSSASASTSSSASSSPTTSPAPSRATSAKHLLLPNFDLYSLQQHLKEAEVQVADAASRTAALADQLPVIEALRDQAGTHPSRNATAAALRNVAFQVALTGRPPVHVPRLHPDPSVECPGAQLLKRHTRPAAVGPNGQEGEETVPGSASVWVLHTGSQPLIAKCEPCHSARAEAALAAGSLQWGSTTDGPAPLRRVADAAAEAVNAARIIDGCGCSSSPVLTPLAVFFRPCSVLDTSLCVGHDGEVVSLYRWCPSGDAYQWTEQEAERAGRQAARGGRGMRAAAAALARQLHALTCDMMRAVADVHRAGWVLGDHKPENMVRCPESGRWLLIDMAGAASVAGAADGWLAGRGTHTEIYAAPEQLRKRHRARRGQPSDVYSAGASVDELIHLAATQFGRAAGQAWLAARAGAGAGQQGCSRRAVRSAEWRAATAVRVAARRLGLCKLVQRCTQDDPAQRPNMEQLCSLMGV